MANAFLQAFLKNCPNVRMTPDEKEELHRLFRECFKAGRAERPS